MVGEEVAEHVLVGFSIVGLGLMVGLGAWVAIEATLGLRAPTHFARKQFTEGNRDLNMFGEYELLKT